MLIKIDYKNYVAADSIISATVDNYGSYINVVTTNGTFHIPKEYQVDIYDTLKQFITKVNGEDQPDQVVQVAQANEAIFKIHEKLEIALKALDAISRGHHDPTPTRRICIDNTEAMKIDTWWQDYYLSNDNQHRHIAQEAIVKINKK